MSGSIGKKAVVIGAGMAGLAPKNCQLSGCNAGMAANWQKWQECGGLPLAGGAKRSSLWGILLKKLAFFPI